MIFQPDLKSPQWKHSFCKYSWPRRRQSRRIFLCEKYTEWILITITVPGQGAFLGFRNIQFQHNLINPRGLFTFSLCLKGNCSKRVYGASTQMLLWKLANPLQPHSMAGKAGFFLTTRLEYKTPGCCKFPLPAIFGILQFICLFINV